MAEGKLIAVSNYPSLLTLYWLGVAVDAASKIVNSYASRRIKEAALSLSNMIGSDGEVFAVVCDVDSDGGIDLRRCSLYDLTNPLSATHFVRRFLGGSIVVDESSSHTVVFVSDGSDVVGGVPKGSGYAVVRVLHDVTCPEAHRCVEVPLPPPLYYLEREADNYISLVLADAVGDLSDVDVAALIPEVIRHVNHDENLYAVFQVENGVARPILTIRFRFIPLAFDDVVGICGDERGRVNHECAWALLASKLSEVRIWVLGSGEHVYEARPAILTASGTRSRVPTVIRVPWDVYNLIKYIGDEYAYTLIRSGVVEPDENLPQPILQTLHRSPLVARSLAEALRIDVEDLLKILRRVEEVKPSREYVLVPSTEPETAPEKVGDTWVIPRPSQALDERSLEHGDYSDEEWVGIASEEVDDKIVEELRGIGVDRMVKRGVRKPRVLMDSE